jgi:hypothetical protein
LIARFPLIADRLTQGRLSIRALVELRDVLTEENHAGVLTRAEGKSQEEAKLLAVEHKPKPIPRDVVRALPMPLVPPARPTPPAEFPVVSAETEPPRPPDPPAEFPVVSAETEPPRPPDSPAAFPVVSAVTERHPLPPEVVRPLTPDLRRLNVTVSAKFIAELEQVRVALSHKCPEKPGPGAGHASEL